MMSPVDVNSRSGLCMSANADAPRGGMPCSETVAFTLGLSAVSIAAPPPHE
jgi:hypothetical protein